MQKLTAIAKEVLSHIEVYLDLLNDADYSRSLPLLSDFILNDSNGISNSFPLCSGFFSTLTYVTTSEDVFT